MSLVTNLNTIQSVSLLTLPPLLSREIALLFDYFLPLPTNVTVALTCHYQLVRQANINIAATVFSLTFVLSVSTLLRKIF